MKECICRDINTQSVVETLESLDPTKPVTHKDLSHRCGGANNTDKPGGYNCGKCAQRFTEFANQHNDRLADRQRILAPSVTPQHNSTEPATVEPA